MTAQEQAREVKRYVLCIDEHLPDGADMEESQLGSWCKWSDIRSLLASLESVTAELKREKSKMDWASAMLKAFGEEQVIWVRDRKELQRDAERMAESVISEHDYPFKNVCTCPACEVARKYRRAG